MKVYFMRMSGGSYDDAWETLKGAWLNKETCQQEIDKYNKGLQDEENKVKEAWDMFEKLSSQYSTDKYGYLSDEDEQKVYDKMGEHMKYLYGFNNDDCYNADMVEYDILDFNGDNITQYK